MNFVRQPANRRSRMTKKIFKSIFVAAMVVMLVSFVLIFGVLYIYVNKVSMNQLRMQADLAAAGVEQSGIAYLDSLDPSGYRITLIEQDGTVLYESSDADADKMENHLEREEVQEALKTGEGEAQRFSRTLLERYLYCARKLGNGNIIRLSLSQYTALRIFLTLLVPLILICIFAIFLSMLLAGRLSRRIVKPLNDVDLDHPLDNEGYDELSPLFKRINQQQTELNEQELELENKQSELDTILGNISEGMILLSADGRIVSINNAAARLLGTSHKDAGGRKIIMINRNIELQDAIDRALSGRKNERVITLKSRQYQVNASPVAGENGLRGAAIVLFDVTDKEQAESMRREFSANVSHELKTPLHAISGYAELMKDGVVREGDVVPFAQKIYKESQRAIQLVEDIISLSHLDEGADDMARVKLDVYKIVKAEAERLCGEAERAGVQLITEGEKTKMTGIPALIQQIIHNLMDNAIKYNHAGGKVTASVRSLGDEVELSVSDTGIGIPEADQQRVFERFYRVDKSHSRAIGGTGLGLSIVKHAVQIHHGRIALQSTPGEGTTITVTMPKK